MNNMKIAVAGTGYVGLSIATLLAQRNEVVAVDVVPEKVEKINKKISPIQDEYIEKYLAGKDADGQPIALSLVATLDGKAAYKDADFVVIAAPPTYDPKKNFFDTSHVEEVIDLVLQVNPDAVMVIKSTVPVGYTRNVREKFSYRERLADGTFKVVVPKIIFAPEFLRESKALYDNLYPSRIIVGFDDAEDADALPVAENREYAPGSASASSVSEAAHTFAKLIKEGAIKEDVPVLFMGSTEAETLTTPSPACANSSATAYSPGYSSTRMQGVKPSGSTKDRPVLRLLFIATQFMSPCRLTSAFTRIEGMRRMSSSFASSESFSSASSPSASCTFSPSVRIIPASSSRSGIGSMYAASGFEKSASASPFKSVSTFSS